MDEQMSNARPDCPIRIGKVIVQIIARDNLERPVSPSALMPTLPTHHCAGPSGLNAHLPSFRPRVDSSDEDEPDRPVWPPRRPNLEFDDGDFEEEENTEPELPKRKKTVRRRVNPFIDAEAGVNGEASNDEGSDNKYYDLDGFIVADDIVLNYLSLILYYRLFHWLCLVHFSYSTTVYKSCIYFSLLVISIRYRQLLVFHGPIRILFKMSDHNSSVWTNSMLKN